MSGPVTGAWLTAVAQHAVSSDVATVGTQALLASDGGVEPEDASPGIGAFITFILLAVIIILLAWSFTRHQRKIRARGALEEERRGAAGEDAAQGSAGGGRPSGTEPGERGGQPAGGEPGGAEPEGTEPGGTQPGGTESGERGAPHEHGEESDGRPRRRTGGD